MVETIQSYRICIGFFGFIRSYITKEQFTAFKSLLPKEATVDIVISCPDTLGELDTTSSRDDIYKNLNDVFDGHTLTVNLYSYNPKPFIARQIELGLPPLSQKTNMHTYRILSLHNSISELCKRIHGYDTVLLTRFDIFSSISNLGTMVDMALHDSIYIWRTIPYESCEDAEDRIIISSQKGIDILSKLYDSAKEHLHIYSGDSLNSEVCIGKYLSLFTDLIKYKQSSLSIGLSPYVNAKYESGFISKINSLLES